MHAEPQWRQLLHQLRQDFAEALPSRFVRRVDGKRVTVSANDEVDRAATSGDAARLERAFADIKDKFGGTTYAQQAALVAAKAWVDKGNTDAARAALTWVADKASDEGYQAVARLRLAGLARAGSSPARSAPSMPARCRDGSRWRAPHAPAPVSGIGPGAQSEPPRRAAPT